MGILFKWVKNKKTEIKLKIQNIETVSSESTARQKL